MNAKNIADSDEQKGGWRQKALNAAGVGYSIGDVAMAGAAHLRGEKDVFQGALIWLAGGIAAARYGNPNPEMQLEILNQKMVQHLQQQGITIPDDVRDQNKLLRQPGFFQKCEQFLYQHPSEMLNAAYGIGAALLLKNGVHELMANEKALLPTFAKGFGKQAVLDSVNGISKNFWMGATIGAGALSGLFIKEDPNARKHAVHGTIIQKAAAYIQEKPLRLTGTLYGLNNIFTVLKAVEDHSKFSHMSGALKPHYFSGLTAATYIVSNVLLTTVSRDAAAAKKLPVGAVTKLEDAAARLIAAQPQQRQEGLIVDMANYLGAQKEVGLSRAEILAYMTKQLATLQAASPHIATSASWVTREGQRVGSDVGNQL